LGGGIVEELEIKAALEDYLGSVRNAATHDEWWSLFSRLVTAVLGPHTPEAAAEKRVIEGCEYTLLGALVFQFNQGMHSHWGAPYQPLSRCLAHLMKEYPGGNFTAVATNGLAIHVCRARLEAGSPEATLEAVDGINLSSPMMTTRAAIDCLTSIMARS
jgi:hypothetical protein